MLRPRPDRSGAAEPSEPRQVREEAAVRGASGCRRQPIRVLHAALRRPDQALVYCRPMSFLRPFRMMPRPAREALAPMMALLGLMLTYFAAASEVEISLHDKTLRVRTFADTAAGALRDAGLALDPRDKVLPSLGHAIEDGERLSVIRSRPVTVEINGDPSELVTAQTHPANVLAEAGVRLLPGDLVLVDGLPLEAWPVDGGRRPSRIAVMRDARRSITVDGRARQITGDGATWAELLDRSGIALREGDRFSAPLHAAPTVAEVSLDRARPVSIEVDGSLVGTWTAADTVVGALADAGVALLGLDRTEPALEAPIPTSSAIEVKRVREEVLVELEPVAFETRYEPLPEVEIDERRVLDTGAYGVRANQVRVRYEDGEETARTVEGEWLAREPEPRVLGYGTNIVVRTMNTPHGTIEYWRAVTMWATSYSPSRAGVPSDAPNFGITASGRTLEKGLVAIDRNLIPFGTRMYVPGYGHALAADTGGGVRGRWIDLGYEDDNWEPWAQYVTVYFLTPMPAPQNIVWIFP